MLLEAYINGITNKLHAPKHHKLKGSHAILKVLGNGVNGLSEHTLLA